MGGVTVLAEVAEVVVSTHICDQDAVQWSATELQKGRQIARGVDEGETCSRARIHVYLPMGTGGGRSNVH